MEPDQLLYISQLDNIFNNSPIGILYTQTDGKIININQSALKILGSPSKNETLNINVLTFPLLQKYGISGKLSECIRKAEIIEYTTKYISFWGKESLLKFIFSPVIETNNEVVAIVIMAEDLSNQAKTKKELEIAKKTIEASTDAIIWISIEGKIIYANQKVLDLFGYSAEELKELPVEWIQNNSTLPKEWNQPIDELVNNKYNRTETILRHKSGRLIPVEINSTLITTDDGDNILTSHIKDISYLKLAQQQLLESENQNKSILQAIPDLILVIDSNYLIVDFHHKSETIKYLTEPELAKKSIKDILPHDISKLFVYEISVALKQNEPVEFEYELKLESGLSYFETRMVKLSDQKVLAIIRDITENKLSKNQLILSETRLIEAQKMAKLGWYELVIDRDVYIGSSEVSKIFFDEEIEGELPQKQIYNQIHPEDRDSFLNSLKEIIEKKLPEYSGEYRIITPKGELKHIANKAFIHYNRQGRIIRRFGVVQDITERKKVEEALALNESRLKEAQAVAKVGWYEAMVNSDQFIGTGETYKIFFDEEYDYPITSEDLKRVLHPEDKDRFFETIRHHISLKSPEFTWEYRLITQKNNLKYVTTKTFLEFDANNQLSRRYGVVQDVTERKLFEEALASSKVRLIEAQSIAKLGYFEMNPIEKEIFWSEEMYRIYNLDPISIQITYDLFWKYIHPEDSQFVKNQLLSNNNKNQKFRYRIITTKGQLKHLQININKELKYKELNYVKGTIQDITDQITIEKTIKEGEAKFRGIFQYSPIGIIIFNQTGDVLHANQAIIAMLQLDDENDLRSYNLFQDENISTKFRNQLKKNNPVIFEHLANYRLSKKKSLHDTTNLMYLEYRISPMGIEESESVGFVALISDITKRKTLEKELIQSKNKAEEADQLKSAFLANMSHEIRTPLNAILGFASLLELEDYSPDEKLNFIQTISINGEHLLNIINDIIDISKIEANQLKLQFSNTNINKIITEVDLLMAKLAPVNVKFVSQKGLPDDEAIIYTDESRLKQILINLINNAFKFTDAGSVTVGYKSDEKNRYLLFSVSDTGCGIPSEKMNEIFQRFHQLDHIKQGAGLGLSISKGLVNLLGGKLWVASEPNKGSTFYFTIPNQKK